MNKTHKKKRNNSRNKAQNKQNGRKKQQEHKWKKDLQNETNAEVYSK